jgi:response regulator RpfG family c-di-GMP phosphodiesterase
MGNSLIVKIALSVALLIIITSTLSIYILSINNNQLLIRVKSKQTEYILSHIQKQKQQSIKGEIEYINLYAKAIKGAVTQALYTLNQEALKNTLASFARLKSIKAIYIYDNIMQKPYFGLLKNNKKLEFIYNWSRNLSSQNSLKYSLYIDNKKIGEMIIIYSMARINKILDKQKKEDLKELEKEAQIIEQKLKYHLFWQILIFLVSMIILLVTLIYLLNNLVNKPLKILQKNMKEFFIFFQDAKKGFSPRELNTNDEFEEITKEINKNIKVVLDIYHELEYTQREILFIVGTVAELRSQETGLHIKRVAEYSKILAKHYGLDEDEVKLIAQASAMHDIGKIAIPDKVLLKPGKLTQEEFEIIKQHTIYGYNILKHSKRGVLKASAIIAYEHHERFDGKGYPRGLKEEEIHIYGRIVAIADVFDALSSDRVYKKAWSDERIFALFKEERGKQFDPVLVDIFFQHIDEFLKIRNEFRDNNLKLNDLVLI